MLGYLYVMIMWIWLIFMPPMCSPHQLLERGTSIALGCYDGHHAMVVMHLDILFSSCCYMVFICGILVVDPKVYHPQDQAIQNGVPAWGVGQFPPSTSGVIIADPKVSQPQDQAIQNGVPTWGSRILFCGIVLH